MTWDSAAAAIRSRMDAQWTTTTIAHQNASFQKPQPPAPFVYFEVLSSPAELIAVGDSSNRLWRGHGIIQAHVFAPVMTGADTAEQYARQIGQIFQGASFDPRIQCWAATVGAGGRGDDDGNWYRVTVTVPFKHDYTG